MTMPTQTSNTRFLGVDLRALASVMAATWSKLQAHPPLKWLKPNPALLLNQSDGQKTVWRGHQKTSEPASNARFHALELSTDYVLHRSFTVPNISHKQLLDTVALEAQSASPFPAQDLIWAHSVQRDTNGATRVHLAMASRKQAHQYMAQHATAQAESATELWAFVPGVSTPHIFTGFGEALRHKYTLFWSRVAYALLCSILLLALAIAVSPLVQLRARAIDAATAYDTLTSQVKPQIEQKEQLLRMAEQLTQIGAVVKGRIEPLKVLDQLTQALPDDTALQTFNLQGEKVRITGLTPNTANLIQTLSEQPGFGQVRAPSAATRQMGTTKENFIVELILDPAVYGVATQPVPAPPSAPVAQQNLAAPPAPAPAPAAPGAATFGGATFGGVRTQVPPAPAKNAEPSSAPKTKGAPQ